ncbi:hypothetical protein EV426DRAFT_707312 [Tirmania nivea]|nr:hypothetical protein EV426DRAFT_707312 [Tirmania nivea]
MPENTISPELVQCILRMRADMDMLIFALQKQGLLNEVPLTMSQTPQQLFNTNVMNMETAPAELEAPTAPTGSLGNDAAARCAIEEPMTVAESVASAVQQLPIMPPESIRDAVMPLATTISLDESFHHPVETVDSHIARTMANNNATDSTSQMDRTTDRFNTLPAYPRQSIAQPMQHLEANSAAASDKPSANDNHYGSGPYPGSDTPPIASPPDMEPKTLITKEQMFLASDEFKRLPPHLKVIHKKKAMESQLGSGAVSPQNGSGSTPTSNTPSPVMKPHTSTSEAQERSAPRKLPTLPLYTPPHLRAQGANASGSPKHEDMPLGSATTSPTPSVIESDSSSTSSHKEISDIDMTKIPPHLRHKYRKRAIPSETSELAAMPLTAGNAAPSIMESNSSTPSSYLAPISPLTLNEHASTVAGKVAAPHDVRNEPSFSPISPTSTEKRQGNATDSIIKPTPTAAYPRGFFSQHSPPSDGRLVRTLYEETCSFIIPKAEPKAGTKKVAKAILALDVPFPEQIARAVDIGAKYSATARAIRKAVAADDIAAFIGTPEHADGWLPKPSPETVRDSGDSTGSVTDGQSQKHSPGDSWQKMVSGIVTPRAQNTNRGREPRRSPGSQSGGSPSAQNNSSPASQVNKQRPGDSWQKIVSGIVTPEAQITRGREPRRLSGSQSGGSPPAQSGLSQASQVNKQSPGDPWQKIVSSVEGKVSGFSTGREVATPPVDSTIIPKTHNTKGDIDLKMHAAPSVEAQSTQKFVLPPHIARLQRNSVIINTLPTSSIEDRAKADIAAPIAPSTVPLQAVADMKSGWAQYRALDTSVNDKPFVTEDSVKTSHSAPKPNQYNNQAWEKALPSTPGHAPTVVNVAERNSINELSVSGCNGNTRPAPTLIKNAESTETNREGATTSEPLSICQNSNCRTLSPTLSIQAIPSYDGNYFEDDDSSAQTVKHKPRVRIPHAALFPPRMVMNQGASAVTIESQAKPSPIPWLSYMMTQAPPHIRARAKLNRGRYVDGAYKTVNVHAGVPIPKYEGEEWEFAQTRNV